MLGQCLAECRATSECPEDDVCDQFGRCRANNGQIVAPLTVSPRAGVAEPVDSVVRLHPTSESKPMPITVVGSDLERMRVEGDDNVEVQCDPDNDSSFVHECVLEGLSADDVRTLQVRLTGGQPGERAGVVRVFSGGELRTITVTDQPAGGVQSTPAEQSTLRRGRYRGQAALAASGLVDEVEAQTQRGISLEIRAKIFLGSAGTGTLVIDGGLGALHPNQKLIGRISPDSPTTGTIRFPAYQFLSSELTQDAATEVFLPAQEVSYEASASSLSLELPMHFGGVVMGSSTPYATWDIGLSRESDLLADDQVDPVPADAQPQYDVNRATEPTDWERAAADAATPEPQSMFGRNDTEKRALLGAWGADGSASLEVCNLPSTVANVLFLFARDDNWGLRAPDGNQLKPPAQLISSGLPMVSKLVSGFDEEVGVSAEAALTSSLQARDIPCAATFSETQADFTGSCGADVTRTIAPGEVDLCDRLQEAYDCEVVEVGDGTVSVDANISYEDDQACTRDSEQFNVQGQIQTVCRMPVTPAPCAEMALCFEPDDPPGTDRGTVESSYLGDQVLSVSGDLLCADSSRSAAIAADRNAELDPNDPARMGLAELLESCRADLAVLRDQSPPSTTQPFAQGLSQTFDEGRCLDAPRLLYALGLASDTDRRRAQDPDAPVQTRSSAMSHRLIQRWLAYHAFVAREAAETERMSAVFRDQPDLSVETLPAADEVIDSTLAGYNLLLHPRFATALAHMPARVLYAPDYRDIVTGTELASEPHHDQATGLPVTMVESIHALLALSEPRLEQAAITGDDQAVEQLGRVLRYLIVIRPLASTLTQRAVDYADANALPAPGWVQRYEGLERKLSSLLSRNINLANSIQLGRNPLGISEQDLPLYFFGDEDGVNSRFSAISDYLIGTDPSSRAWAPSLVQRAQSTLDSARDAYVERMDYQVQQRQSQAELDGQLAGVRQNFGEQLAALCGAPDGLATRKLIEEWRPFSEDSCFVALNSPTCEFNVDGYIAMMDARQVEYHMCTVSELRKDVGFIVGFLAEELNAIADDLDQCNLEYPVECSDGERACLRCTTPRDEFIGRVTPDTFRALSGINALGARAIEDAQNTCNAQFPNVDTRLPSADDVPDSPTSRAECYRGALGEAALGIRTAQQDVEIARSQYNEMQDAYDIQMRSCLREQTGDLELETALRAHNQTMSNLGKGKLTADIAANVASGVKDCVGAIDVVDDVVTVGTLGSITCAAAATEQAANSTSDGLQFTMDEAGRSHEQVVQQIEAEVATDVCINDAEMHLVGTQTAALQINRALSDLDSAQFQLQDLKVQARSIFDDGNAALEAVRGRYVAPMSHDLWLDEDVERFLSNMRLARRVAFLAVRAVEYETQQTLGLRADVLEAALPAQLQSVLDQLWAAAGTRGIQGNRPTDLKVVLSLRNQLLQLGDQTWMSDGEQQLTEEERFRLLLTDSRYAQYDEQGNYTGQRIPFRLTPLGAMDRGQTDSIPVLAGSDCAERLWSVNASIVGSDQLYRGDEPSFTRVELEKANTFYSQWCDARRGESFQSASVRPSRNLFRDPSVVDDYQIDSGLGVVQETELFSRARIEAYFNVDRTSFEADDYANGQTSELAARGLYGDYALTIPAEVLNSDGDEDQGLVLEEVDDVLLRLDYISVAH